MDHSILKKLAAWLIHIFTASGIFLGFLALLASINNDFTLAILFLGLALFVDGVDGTLARWLDVGKVTPNIDGSILDIIIDYFNYVLVPTFMIHWFGFVGEKYSIPICFLILLVSCYTFANKQIKTKDYYFSYGFVRFYFYSHKICSSFACCLFKKNKYYDDLLLVWNYSLFAI
jgi:phosphatidylcholine synthase